MKSNLLTLKETAKKLRLSQRSILRYLKARKLKGVKMGEGQTSPWRIPKEEIQKFLNRYSNK